MGRLASKKKIKACDPFSKTGGKYFTRKDLRKNAPPPPEDCLDGPRGKAFAKPAKKRRRTGSEPESRPLGGKSALVLAVKPKFTKESKTSERKRASDAAPAPPAAAPASAPAKRVHLSRLPGETIKAFNRRVDDAAREERAKNAGFKSKTASERHRQYMDRKTEHKKGKRVDQAKKRLAKEAVVRGLVSTRRGLDVDDASESLRYAETVEFGDRVEAPPTFTTAPRLPKFMRGAKPRTKGFKGLLVEAMAAGGDAKPADTVHARKAAEAAAETARLRQDAIAAYKDMKKRRGQVQAGGL